MLSAHDIDIRRANESDIDGMDAIFYENFYGDLGRFATLMCPENSENSTIAKLLDSLKAILKEHLMSQYSKFFVAYEDSDDPGSDSTLTYGWLSLSTVDVGTAQGTYEASVFTDYTCSEVLRRENDLSEDSPCAELLKELMTWSKDGQARWEGPLGRYAVINGLFVFLECPVDVVETIYRKLLASAVGVAQRDGLQIWAQIPVPRQIFFLQAGFTIVGRFSLDLNQFKPHGSPEDLGRKTWVQLVYYPQVNGGGASEMIDHLLYVIERCAPGSAETDVCGD